MSAPTRRRFLQGAAVTAAAVAAASVRPFDVAAAGTRRITQAVSPIGSRADEPSLTQLSRGAQS